MAPEARDTSPSESGSGEHPGGANSLRPMTYVVMDGERLKYFGHGVSGSHWFEKPNGRLVEMPDPLVREVLGSGLMKRSSSG